VFRYRLNDPDLESGATVTTAQTYTPWLFPGSHTLYVQERDEAGNWSDSGTLQIWF
jgi:hypothetical protein